MPILSSIRAFRGDGARTHWEVNFDGGYIKPEHVFVKRNDIYTPAVFAGESTVVITPPVPEDEDFTIERRTPNDKPIVDFAEGARLTEENLDTIAKQALFVASEALDRGEGALATVSPRFLAVPSDEVAPQIAPRSSLKGKALAVSADGSKIVGINFNGTDFDLETPFILHEGQDLDVFLRSLSDLVSAEQVKLQQQIDDLVELADDVVASATSTAEITNRLNVLTSDFDTLSGIVDALTSLEGGTEGLATLIANETAQRITGDQALAASINLIGAKNGANNAFILDLNSVKVSSTESLAQRFSALKSETDNALALIQQEATTRAADDLAEVTARTQMGVSIRNDLGANLNAAVTSLTNARVAGDQAEATARQTLATTLRGETDNKITAAVDVEKTARIAGDNAEASARSNLAAALRTETDTKIGAAVGNEATARVNGDAAEATARQNLGASLQTNINGVRTDMTALVTNEAAARVSGDQAEANARGLLAARVSTAESAILNEATVRANADTAITSQVNALSARTATTEANIVNESTARANAIAAEASARSALAARVGNTESSITTQAGVLANVLGRTAAFWEVTAVAGGRAKLRVYADANGGGGVDIEGDVRISGDLIVSGTVTGAKMATNTIVTEKIIQNAISNSAYWQTSYGGSMSAYPQNQWVDFNPSVYGGSGGGSGGSGGGGGGIRGDEQIP